MIHETPSPLAGKTVKVQPRGLPSGNIEGEGPHDYRVEDWWDRVGGKSWAVMRGNPACLAYALRGAKAGLPIDNNVLYGKIGSLGHLIHVSEVLP